MSNTKSHNSKQKEHCKKRWTQQVIFKKIESRRKMSYKSQK